eukprot:Amastigsp_a183392_7.p3 type:complete len:123 gc:universal Amastigsp_a183392_7:733-365(-)
MSTKSLRILVSTASTIWPRIQSRGCSPKGRSSAGTSSRADRESAHENTGAPARVPAATDATTRDVEVNVTAPVPAFVETSTLCAACHRGPEAASGLSSLTSRTEAKKPPSRSAKYTEETPPS